MKQACIKRPKQTAIRDEKKDWKPDAARVE
jgi:hypothetical protein